mmetsp:Transcript_39036/g.112130  ORF Transcript_39036/g.112130 Transcript_39036/m.112130 type:complete len:399 (+) Transcript_39036:730-1926(+)
MRAVMSGLAVARHAPLAALLPNGLEADPGVIGAERAHHHCRPLGQLRVLVSLKRQRRLLSREMQGASFDAGLEDELALPPSFLHEPHLAQVRAHDARNGVFIVLLAPVMLQKPLHPRVCPRGGERHGEPAVRCKANPQLRHLVQRLPSAPGGDPPQDVFLDDGARRHPPLQLVPFGLHLCEAAGELRQETQHGDPLKPPSRLVHVLLFDLGPLLALAQPILLLLRPLHRPGLFLDQRLLVPLGGLHQTSRSALCGLLNPLLHLGWAPALQICLMDKGEVLALAFLVVLLSVILLCGLQARLQQIWIGSHLFQAVFYSSPCRVAAGWSLLLWPPEGAPQPHLARPLPADDEEEERGLVGPRLVTKIDLATIGLHLEILLSQFGSGAGVHGRHWTATSSS